MIIGWRICGRCAWFVPLRRNNNNNNNPNNGTRMRPNENGPHNTTTRFSFDFRHFLFSKVHQHKNPPRVECRATEFRGLWNLGCWNPLPFLDVNQLGWEVWTCRSLSTSGYHHKNGVMYRYLSYLIGVWSLLNQNCPSWCCTTSRQKGKWVAARLFRHRFLVLVAQLNWKRIDR